MLSEGGSGGEVPEGPEKCGRQMQDSAGRARRVQMGGEGGALVGLELEEWGAAGHGGGGLSRFPWRSALGV